MSSLINKGISTIQNDGLIVFATRVIKYAIIKLKRVSRGENVENLQKWKLLQNKFKGERIFIVGNGPSLNRMPLYLLQNEYTMTFNRFNLMFERMEWTPDFYMVTDDLVVQDMHSQINSEILPKVDYAFFPDIHPSNVEFDKFIEPLENVYWLNTDKPEFQDDLPNCGINKTVVNAGIQVAGYLGFSNIYLLGVDMTFGEQKVKKINSRNWEAEDTDPNHFDPRYFGKGHKYHNPTVHEMAEKFEMAKKYFDKKGINIWNAGIGGNLNAFPRIDFSSLFTFDEHQLKEMFSNSPILKSKGLTVEDLVSSFPLVTETLSSYPNGFCTPLDLGIQLISVLIFEYVPLGPYKGRIYFVGR